LRTIFIRPAAPQPPPRIKRDEINVPPPNEIEDAEPPSKVRTYGLPIIMVVAIVGMIATTIRSGRTFQPTMMLFPMMMLMSMGGLMFGQSSGKSRGALLRERKESTRGLGVIREKIFDRGLSMHEGLQYAYPDPATLPSIVDTPRMWEVTPISDSFTAVRYGLGEVELASRIVPPEAPAGEFLEPVSWVHTVKLLRHHSTVSGMPVALTAARIPVIGFTGDRDVILGMVRSMLLQAAVTHGPDNLAMMVLTDEPDAPTWSWMKWLPQSQHPYDSDLIGSKRMLYSDWSTLQASVGGDEDDEDAPRVIDFHAHFDPAIEFSDETYRHVFVVVDSEVSDKYVDSLIAPRGGVTWLLIDPPASALNASEGITFRCDPDRTVWRSEADKPLQEPVKVAVADQVSQLDARTLARKLARHEIATTDMLGRQSKRAERGKDWQSLMRIPDPGAMNPLDVWSTISKYGDKRRLRIPIGFLPNGDRLELDLKQAAEGGTGPHGMLIGTTGSGKSEFLRNLVINGCASHSPHMLNWLLVDFKGGPTFLGMSDLPHVSAVITNMEEEAHLVERMREMINGEIERRYAILRRADELSSRYDIKDIKEYAELRERGVELPPLPTLLIIIDEFAELLALHPEYGDLFKRLGRVGRSIGIQLLYASQNLDNAGRTSGLESNIGYKIGLKTQTAAESRQLLDGSDAAYRLPGLPGHGVLRTTGGELTHFYAGYTGAPYFPPTVPLITKKDHSAPAPVKGAVPHAFTAATIEVPDDGREIESETEVPERTEEELDNAPTLFTTIVDRLGSAEFDQAYRMWAPPLEVKTLDEVQPALAAGWQPHVNTELPQLRIPFGLFDQPAKHSQPVWNLDTTSQNVLVIGGTQSGKSTAVKTLVGGLAAYNTPEQVQIYIVDYAGGGLGPLAKLPHVGGLATRAEPDAINRMLMQIKSIITTRERLFRENGSLTLTDYRRARTNPDCPFLDADPYGDVYLIIDGWDAAVAEGQVLQQRGAEVESLFLGALNYGVHLVITTGRMVEMRGLEPQFKTIIELPNDSGISRVSSQLAKTQRPNPGQAIVTGSALHGLVALPRIDGIADVAPESIQSGLDNLVDTLSAAFTDRSAERLLTLPTSMTREELAVLVDEADRISAETESEAMRAKRRMRLPLGVREDTLGVAYAEMYRDPHLLIVGESKSGKSEQIGTVFDSITRRFSSQEEAAVIFYDKKRRHLGIGGNTLFAHVHNDDDFVAAVGDLNRTFNLDARDLPPGVDAATREARSWWTGPEIFILIDDYHLVVPRQNLKDPIMWAMAPWLENEPLARGFHFVIARDSADFLLVTQRDPLLRRLVQDQAPTLMLSGSKWDGEMGGIKFERFGTPGRAKYVQHAQSRRVRVQGAWSGVKDTEVEEFTD